VTASGALPEPLLRVRKVEKSYAEVVLTQLDLDLRGGEVHALVGANGAGKSTLSRIICGLTSPDRGAMTLGGTRYAPRTRRDAEAAGVQMVMQELNLVPTLSVAENLFLNRLPSRHGFIAWSALRTLSARALAAVGLQAVDPRTPVSELGVGQQQLVELAAALDRPCRVLVLDEPTAVLTPPEIDLVFDHLRRLREQGIGILYISHRLEEIRRISDRITVLRDGRVVGTRATGGISVDEVVRLMVGERGVAALHREEHRLGAVALRVEGLTRGERVREVQFEVRHGEILGLAGLVGSGRTETLRAVFGADLPTAGRVRRGSGPPLAIRGPWDAVQAGIGMVPEDRKDQALLLARSVRVNMTLADLSAFARPRWWLDRGNEVSTTGAMCGRLDVRCNSLDQPVAQLSGGNQQKVVIARWLLRDCDVLLFDEPTRGIDVGAKVAIYRLLRGLAARGKALVVVSSELTELTALCDRIGVMSAGRLVQTFERAEWSEEAILKAALSGYAGRAVAPPPH
jgi:ribose transport system ATP-binding protein